MLWTFNRTGSRFAATFIFGFFWAALFAIFSGKQNLPQLLVSQPVQIFGCVIAVKNHSSHYQRLQIMVDQTFLNTERNNFKGKVNLGNFKPLDKTIKPGWCGEFYAVLKPVHGRLNSRGFDYEAWAYVEDIKATGVLKSVVQAYPGYSLSNRYLRFRSVLADQLKALLIKDSTTPLVLSLALGDRKMMTEQQWTLLRRTGTSHLLAISGLHIGLVFWMISILASLCWRLIPAACLAIPAQKAGWISGLLCSAIYLILTGMPLSGQRAWIMLLVATSLLLFNERTDFSRCFCTALVVVLLIWPSSILSIGFWFSFAAVGLILLQFIHSDKALVENFRLLNFRKKQNLLKILMIQLVLSVAMLPLSLFYFGEMSLISPLANIFAIPLISFVVLPLILIGLALLSVGLIGYSKLAFEAAQFCLQNLSLWLEKLVDLDWSWSMPVIHHQQSIILMTFAIFLWLYLKYWPGKWLFCFILIPLFLNPKPVHQKGEFTINVFDVGQGLAIWINTADKNLLLDTGFGRENGFTYYESIIYPILKADGVNKLDAVIISHGDADHAGGFSALLKSELKPNLIWGSQKNIDSMQKYCTAAHAWYWNGVKFQFLTQSNVSGDNNQSCVLKISSGYGSVLLPGDIEKEAEQKLLMNFRNSLQSDVLIVPHHGSRTSSTRPFIKAVNPELAIFSAGYLNRYGHPAEIIAKRYQRRDIELLNTACQGQITIRFEASGLSNDSLRQTNQPFWRHQCSN